MLELLAVVCFSTAWLVPNHYPPWSSSYNETISGLGLFLLCLALAKQINQRTVPLISWMPLGVAIIPALQWSFGLLTHSGDTWISALYLSGLSTAIILGGFWVKVEGRKSARLLSVSIIAAGIISSIVALSQFLSVGKFGIWVLEPNFDNRSIANLGQPNNLATLIGLGTVSLLLLYEQGRIGTVGAVFVLALLIGGAATTQSRTALLFGPTILISLLLARHRGMPFRTTPLGVGLVTAAHWASNALVPAVQSALLLSGVEVIGRSGLETPRLKMWPMLIDASLQRPWTGYGWLQVGAAELEVVNRYPPINELWLHAHNLFLDLIIWCGYPLGLLLCGLIIYWFVSRTWQAATTEAVVGMMFISVLGAHAMLELPHHYAYFLIPAGLWIGQVEASRGGTGPLSPRWNLLPPLLSLVLAIAICKDYPAVEEDFRLVRFENLRIGSVRATEPAPNAPFLSSLTAFLRFARTTPAKGMSDAELGSMEAITKRYPYAASLYRLSTALALNGRVDEARERFISIRQMFEEGTYLKLRRELREKIANGAPAELAALERSLPPPY